MILGSARSHHTAAVSLIHPIVLLRYLLGSNCKGRSYDCSKRRTLIDRCRKKLTHLQDKVLGKDGKKKRRDRMMDFFLTFGDFHRQLPLKYSAAHFSLVSHSSVQPSRRGADMQLILVPRYIYGPSLSAIPDVIYHPSIHSLLLLPLPPKTPLILPSIPTRLLFTHHALRLFLANFSRSKYIATTPTIARPLNMTKI